MLPLYVFHFFIHLSDCMVAVVTVIILSSDYQLVVF